jgi:hypothetical protein
LKEGLARGGVSSVKISDIGEEDKDRIATLDVTRFLARMEMSLGEEDGITGRERFVGGQREDRDAASTALDFRNPLFVGRIRIHL